MKPMILIQLATFSMVKSESDVQLKFDAGVASYLLKGTRVPMVRTFAGATSMRRRLPQLAGPYPPITHHRMQDDMNMKDTFILSSEGY